MIDAQATVYATLKNVAPTWPTIAPQDAPRRRLTYFRVSGTDFSTYDGDGAGAARRRFQIDAWEESAAAARRLSDEARAALYASGGIGAVTDNPDDFEADTKLYRASFDVEVWE